MRITRTEAVPRNAIPTLAVDDLLALIQPMEDAGWAVAQIIPQTMTWVVVFEREA